MFHPAAYQPMGGCGTGQLKEEGWFWRLPGPEELKSIDEELKRAGCLNKDTTERRCSLALLLGPCLTHDSDWLWSGSYKHEMNKDKTKSMTQSARISHALQTNRHSALVVMADLYVWISLRSRLLLILKCSTIMALYQSKIWIMTYDMTGPKISITELQITSHI